MAKTSLHLLGLHFWMAYGPKFKIDLHGHYVAQNLQKCVMYVASTVKRSCQFYVNLAIIIQYPFQYLFYISI